MKLADAVCYARQYFGQFVLPHDDCPCTQTNGQNPLDIIHRTKCSVNLVNRLNFVWNYCAQVTLY